ncbi:MAG: murein L,D-transpeptidase catalytic domain family protein [Bdellovibrionaceae bacterium]|nr:murein L,D-transpeptidase catalytic domain family protein [Pseudobdellovibrionaceae bacterium]
MRFLLHLSMLCLFGGTAAAQNSPVPRDPALLEKVIGQGVPRELLTELVAFEAANLDREFLQSEYVCLGQEWSNPKPCAEKRRLGRDRTVRLHPHAAAVIIDYSLPSDEKRFYLIHWDTGEVEKFFATHGSGSGTGRFATRFSNRKDSRQTSLGFYLAEGVYKGTYGKTLRMSGLEPANSRAYHRDIVLHGAWYASEAFLSRRNPRTGEAFGRLGLSWGCPALSLAVAGRVIDSLKNGALIYHAHPGLIETARRQRGDARGPDETPLPPRRPVDLPGDPQIPSIESSLPSSSSALTSE